LARMALPTTTLGRTGETVTKLGYGAMELRTVPLDDAIAATMLNRVLDAGVNLIDTSPDYGNSEEHIGRSIPRRRDEYFLASKCGCPVGPGVPLTAQNRPPHEYTGANVRAGVEQSLRRMQTDHIDLVQFHISPSPETLEQAGAIDELLTLRDEGK